MILMNVTDYYVLTDISLQRLLLIKLRGLVFTSLKNPKLGYFVLLVENFFYVDGFWKSSENLIIEISAYFVKKDKR